VPLELPEDVQAEKQSRLGKFYLGGISAQAADASQSFTDCGYRNESGRHLQVDSTSVAVVIGEITGVMIRKHEV